MAKNLQSETSEPGNVQPGQLQPGKSQWDARGLRFAIVVSRFNSAITERLLRGAMDALERSGAGEEDVEVVYVPGHSNCRWLRKNWRCRASTTR